MQKGNPNFRNLKGLPKIMKWETQNKCKSQHMGPVKKDQCKGANIIAKQSQSKWEGAGKFPRNQFFHQMFALMLLPE